MGQRGRAVLSVVIGLLLSCAVGALVMYVALRPVLATGPDAGSRAAPKPESGTVATDAVTTYCNGAVYRCVCEQGGASMQVTVATLTLSPDAGTLGEPIVASGEGFAPGSRIALRLGVPNAGLGKENLATVDADPNGAFAIELALPAEWPGTRAPIVEQELVIAAVDEEQGQTLTVARFVNTEGAPAACLGECAAFARDAALAYIAAHHAGQAPARYLYWEQTALSESAAPQGSPGEMTYEFAGEGWMVTVSYPVGGSTPIAYAVKVTNPSTGFQWEGKVDAYANVIVTQ